jgi:hypothetical protein
VTIAALDRAFNGVFARRRRRNHGIFVHALLDRQVPSLVFQRVDGQTVDAAILGCLGAFIGSSSSSRIRTAKPVSGATKTGTKNRYLFSFLTRFSAKHRLFRGIHLTLKRKEFAWKTSNTQGLRRIVSFLPLDQHIGFLSLSGQDG